MSIFKRAIIAGVASTLHPMWSFAGDQTIFVSWQMLEGSGAATPVPLLGAAELISLAVLLCLIAIRASRLRRHVNAILIVSILSAGGAASFYVSDASGGWGTLVISAAEDDCTESLTMGQWDYAEITNQCPNSVRLNYDTFAAECDDGDLICTDSPCVEQNGLIEVGQARKLLNCPRPG